MSRQADSPLTTTWLVRRMLSRKWLIASVLAVLAILVMLRLGIWQLDRLQQRRESNARIQEQINKPELTLDGNLPISELENAEFRAIRVVGEYDPQPEIALRNQYWQNRWGVHLLTPLRVEGTDLVVLVDRGRIPSDEFESGDWSEYAEPGRVEVRGIIRNPRSKADYGSRSDLLPAAGEPVLRAWNFVNIPAIAEQNKITLLPVYIQQSPDTSHTDLPYRNLPELELTEGSHMSYALQWFLFAGILAVGYPIYLVRQESRKNSAQPTAPLPVSKSVF